MSSYSKRNEFTWIKWKILFIKYILAILVDEQIFDKFYDILDNLKKFIEAISSLLSENI